MLQDMENHKITILDKPNPHILVTGKSGYGKTFFCTQLINEKICVGKRILIVDFSGSYTNEELKKSQFKYERFVKILNPVMENVEWKIKCNKIEIFIEEISSALMEALGIKIGYMPKKILLEGVEKVVNCKNCFAFSYLFQIFEGMLEEEKREDEPDNTRISTILGLLSRLMPYKDLLSIQIVQSKEQQKNFYPITILQLSDYSDIK